VKTFRHSFKIVIKTEFRFSSKYATLSIFKVRRTKYTIAKRANIAISDFIMYPFSLHMTNDRQAQ